MANTILNQATAVSLQLTDYALLWQGGQSPSTRKMPISNLATYYLALTGGTVTGDITFSAAKPKIKGNAGTVRAVQLLTGSTVRWQLDANATAESGTNAGSDFELWSYTDAGAQLTKALSIKRSSGAVTIVGTNTNDSASSGQVGEVISASATVNVSSGSATDVATISLTAGDWDVHGSLSFTNAGATFTQILGWVSTTSASVPSFPNGGAFAELQASFTAAANQVVPVGFRRLSLSTTTTVYLGTLHSFAGSGPTSVSGFVEARRCR